MEVQYKILQHETMQQLAWQFQTAASMLRDENAMLQLEAISPHDAKVCERVLALCAPWLQELGVQLDEAWLRALYVHLSDNLFPDEISGHPRRALDNAQRLYLAALESVLVRPCDEFDPLTDLYGLDPDLSCDSRMEKEYDRFVEAARALHFVALMRLGRELQGFDPASHTIGVHNIAMHTATMAARAGLQVDLKLISAASLGHDIGKFGCRGEDAKRIPYLHYYYTWQWFSEYNMEQIGHVSANHSTWDLEFENLPIESLLLIYADFRVRGTREAGQKEKVAIYTLEESYEMIFSKLYNMTPEKQKRYQTVYYKLQDFESYLAKLGVPSELDQSELLPAEHLDASLHTDLQALQALRHMTFENNVRLMHTISVDESFAQLLEQAKTEKNLHRIRTYLGLFGEYSTYMTKANKRKTLAFLYELLMHQDGDVRRTAGYIMGQILANSGPKYRKERPQAASKDVLPPTMMALLDESVQLWTKYIELCLHPDHKVSAKHALRIGNSLKDLCQTMFTSCEEKEAQVMLRPLLDRLYHAEKTERSSLVDALYYVPSRLLQQEDRVRVVDTLGVMLGTTYVPLQMMVLRYLERLNREMPELNEQICAYVRSAQIPGSDSAQAVEFLRSRILGVQTPYVHADYVAKIYLSNLKNAVHWTVKLVQIDMVCAHVQQNPSAAFHAVMHLSNLLSVSEHLPVREYAGESLLKVAPSLTVDQINEITVDLVRELENGQEQISRYIPPYVGRLMCMLPEKELHEAIDSLRAMVHSMSIRAARASLYTLGVLLNTLSDAQESLADEVLGLLMTGICHYEKTIHQTALSVLCRDVFGSEHISETRKHAYFVRLNKKLLTILSEPREGTLTFFNRAAMLNHLYRYIIHHEVEYGEFCFLEALPVAFFPGTFDPFSVGHKRIVQEIHKLGFEVYLAIDEFSWSKNTLAKLQRRRIAGMSIADLWDTYLFPDDIRK